MILLGWFLFLVLVDSLPSIKQDSNEVDRVVFSRLSNLKRLTQKLDINSTGFYRTDLRLKNPGLESLDVIKVSLLDSGNMLVAAYEINGRNIGDPDWVRFDWGKNLVMGKYELVIEIVEVVDGKLEIGLNGSSMSVNNYYRQPGGLLIGLKVLRTTLEKLVVNNKLLCLYLGFVFLVAVKNDKKDKG